MRLALIASFLLVMASRATAQPGTVAPPPAVPSPAISPVAPAPPAPPAALAPTPPPADGDRDEVAAVMLSLGGTAASCVALLSEGGTDHNHSAWAPVAAVSALFAPTFGHWYAGTPLTGWLGLRVGSLVGLFYLEAQCDGCNFDKLALVIYGLTALGDIASAPADVRRHNEERRKLRDLAVAPMIQRGAGGIVLGARF